MIASRSLVVLLVEPNSYLSDSVTRMLAQLGCYCFDVWNATMAISLFAEENSYIDFALISEDLSDSTSRELLHGLRNIRPDVPVYVMSSEGTDSLELTAQGYTDVIPKPVGFEDWLVL